MKKIYIKTASLICISAAVAFGISSCKKYLNVNPQGQTSEAEIISSPTAANDLVTGVYNIFYAGDPFGNDIDGFQFIVITDIASDDADKGSSPSDYGDALQIDNLQATASNGVLNNVWNGHYQGIARANQALDKLANASFDAATKSQLIAEVKFLRALFYFNLVRLYGGVPLVDRVPLPSEANSTQFTTRATSADIYKFIVSDLTAAATDLAVKNSNNVGRATKGAAQALLAKVYLYQKDYPNAYTQAQAVITAGQYSLYPDYNTLFRQAGNNSSESIFEIQAGKNTACTAAIDRYTITQGPRAGGKYGWSDLGYGFNTPSASLAGAYEATDLRRAASIIFINPTTATNSTGTVLWDGFRIPSKDSVEGNRYSYKAYHSRTAEDNCGNTDRLPKHIQVLRYADLLLIHAEAALQTGKAGESLTDLTAVRARVKLAPVAATLTNIWRERRVELALEHDRFFDLVRQDAVQPGRAAAAFAADGNKTWSATRALFPIPQAQIDLSGGNLKQNPGY